MLQIVSRGFVNVMVLQIILAFDFKREILGLHSVDTTPDFQRFNEKKGNKIE